MLKVNEPEQLTPAELIALRTFVAAIFAHADCQVRRVAIFGSRARACSSEESDLDVAVFLSGARDASKEIRIARAAAEVADATGIGLHAVCLYDAGPEVVLRREIEREGITVWPRTAA